MIKRIRYVIVRTEDEAVFCGFAKNYQFKTLDELGDTEIKTYMSEAKAKASFLLFSVTPQEPRWIPVTEKLPDNSGRYWVNYSSGYVGIAHYYESVLKWGCTTTERIVAWMPLPKPYKEVKE